MIIGWFGYGGNAWQADQFREDINLKGWSLLTCHEHPNADVKYSSDSINNFIDMVDVIILPSAWKTQPAKSVNKLAQAWSRGKPCIVSPLPAYRKYVEHGKDAFIAESKEEFLKYLNDLATDNNLRKKLGEAGRYKAYQKLHPRTLINKFLDNLNPRFLQIIIPHYTASTDLLNLAIESVLGSTGPERDILVVSSSEIKPSFEDPRVRVLHQDQRLSFSQANNWGLRNIHPRTTHILLLNDDTIVSKHTIQAYFDAMGTKDIILNPYSNCDKGWLHNDSLNVAGVSLVPAMKLPQIEPIVENVKTYCPSTDSTLINSPFCAFYATMMTRKIFETVGYLSTEFSNGGEDADYCYRARRHGFDSYWTKSAFVFHFGGASRKYAENIDAQAHKSEDDRNISLLHKRWPKQGKKAIKRIGIWTGPAWETWDLQSYKTTGIGGSETCAGRLAEMFASDNHVVTLFGEHENKEYGSVILKHFSNFHPEEDYFDLFIASRNLAPVVPGLRAKKTIVWVHDIWLLSGQQIPKSQLDRVDAFICLSPWHRKFFSDYHGVPLDKIQIIPNGINVELFSSIIENKVYGKMHYSSSPDRGLDNIIYCLPWIRDSIPEIHLDVYYGFHNWKSAAQKRNDPNELRKIAALEQDLEKVKDSVHFKGRVNQPELAKAWEKAYVWGYPSLFTETYCITAKEASLSRTPIVCSNIAALQTTVGPFGYIIQNNPYSADGRKEFINEVIRLHQDSDYWLERSEQSYLGIKDISWSDVYQNHWKSWI